MISRKYLNKNILMKKLINFIYTILKILLLYYRKILPRWLRYIISNIIFITFLIYFKKCTGIGIEELLLNIIFIKSIIWFNIFFNLVWLVNNLICLYINSFDYKVNIPKYFPNFIINWYNVAYKISKSETKYLFVKLYYKNIFFNILFLIISLIFLLIIN